MRDFTSLKIIRNGLGPLILSFESVTKVSEQMLNVFFRFMVVRKSKKQTPKTLLLPLFYPTMTQKQVLNAPITDIKGLRLIDFE